MCTLRFSSGRMHHRDHSFLQPIDNLVCDEVLLQLADRHSAGEYLRFWESPVYFIVLGRIGKTELDVNLDTTIKDGIPVLRRSSGGGTVLQGPGCLNYTLVLSKQKYPEINDLRSSYAWISDKIIRALSHQGINGVFCPISDIATLEEKKFSGNAQHRGKNYILHHGTILYNFDLNLISKYLLMPSDMPVYRKARRHLDFVTNIPVEPEGFKRYLAIQFGFPATPQPMTAQELLALQNFSRKI